MAKLNLAAVRGWRFSNERLAELGALGVLSGLLLEVVLALIFRTHRSLWEEWGPLVADVLIAGGVWVEIYFGRKASDESAERVSAANERAAAAELAAEQLRAQFAWRRLSADAIKLLSNSLRESWESLGEYRYREISITYFGQDPETSNFAHEIGSVFTQNGWTVQYVSAAYAGTIIYGLLISPAPHSPSTMFDIARKALADAGLEFKDGETPNPFMSQDEQEQMVSFSASRVYVGPKPQLELE